jgi:hypothetical protein
VTDSKVDNRPRLSEDLPVEEFDAHYWTMAELGPFAQQLGVPKSGPKPELVQRLRRRLQGMPDESPRRPRGSGPRDSDKPLRRDTPVVNYKSDDATRAFFEREIGPDFHFTYHLNQWRKTNEPVTYGDLVDEWVADRERRREGYKAPIARHGEYNRYVRDFFADERNKGKTMADVAAAWNAAKKTRAGRRYERGGG